MPLIRAGGTEDALEFHARDHIGISAVGIGLVEAGIIGPEAGGQDHRPRSEGPAFLCLVQANGLGGAEFLAGPALALLKEDTVVFVDDILERDSLRVFHIDGLALNQFPIEEVVHLFGAFFGTGATCDAAVHVHVPGTCQDLHLKIVGLPMNGGYVGQSDQFDIQVPVDLDQFR